MPRPRKPDGQRRDRVLGHRVTLLDYQLLVYWANVYQISQAELLHRLIQSLAGTDVDKTN
jgi:hypothetical protein